MQSKTNLPYRKSIGEGFYSSDDDEETTQYFVTFYPDRQHIIESESKTSKPNKMQSDYSEKKQVVESAKYTHCFYFSDDYDSDFDLCESDIFETSDVPQVPPGFENYLPSKIEYFVLQFLPGTTECEYIVLQFPSDETEDMVDVPLIPPGFENYLISGTRYEYVAPLYPSEFEYSM